MNNSYKYFSRYRFSKIPRSIINRVNHFYARKNLKRGAPQVAVFAFDHIGLDINNYGIYEEDILDAITSFLSDSLGTFKYETILDIGANIGNHSLYFQKVSKKIYAFEPNPKTFELLKFNTRNHEDIHLYNLGLSNVTGQENLNELPANIGASYINPSNNLNDNLIHKINISKLDDLNELNQEKISILKIDVEGYEWEVIDGGRNLINKNKPIIIFEHNTEPKVDKALDLEQFLKEEEYELFKIFKNFDYLSNFFLKALGALMRLFLGDKLVISKIDSLPTKKYSSFPLIIAIPKK